VRSKEIRKFLISSARLSMDTMLLAILMRIICSMCPRFEMMPWRKGEKITIKMKRVFLSYIVMA